MLCACHASDLAKEFHSFARIYGGASIASTGGMYLLCRTTTCLCDPCLARTIIVWYTCTRERVSSHASLRCAWLERNERMWQLTSGNSSPAAMWENGLPSVGPALSVPRCRLIGSSVVPVPGWECRATHQVLRITMAKLTTKKPTGKAQAGDEEEHAALAAEAKAVVGGIVVTAAKRGERREAARMNDLEESFQERQVRSNINATTVREVSQSFQDLKDTIDQQKVELSQRKRAVK